MYLVIFLVLSYPVGLFVLGILPDLNIFSESKSLGSKKSQTSNKEKLYRDANCSLCRREISK